MVNKEHQRVEAQDESIVVLDDGMESPDAIRCCFGLYGIFIS
jgi:hypothetical protein